MQTTAEIMEHDLGLEVAIDYARHQVFMARSTGNARMEADYSDALAALLDRQKTRVVHRHHSA